MQRRDFLAHTVRLGGALAFFNPLSAQAALTRERLIFIFLRGAVDGLSVVAPYGEDNYYRFRPGISIPPPNADNGLIDLDGRFGLHPSLEILFPLWKEHKLAFIHACGLENPTRSHFEAQSLIERGINQSDRIASGWLNRLFTILPGKSSSENAVAIGDNIPLILQGRTPVVTLSPSLRASNLDSTTRHLELASTMYSGKDILSKTFQEGYSSTLKLRTVLSAEAMKSANGAPDATSFVRDAQRLGGLIRSLPQLQVGVLSLGGWDTHISQGNTQGQLANKLRNLGNGIDALIKEMGDAFHQTTVVVMSEFGRTVRENGNGGTDHGRGNVMWVMGGNVQGGKIHGRWPGLTEPDLFENRDLKITTNYLAPLKEILRRRFHLTDKEEQAVFPNSSGIAPTRRLILPTG